MITKFDSLYAGHIDMDDIGYGGTAVNSRVFSNDRLVSTFAKARNLARLLDRRGYDTFWLAEHHFQREGYECIPNVLMLALDLGVFNRTAHAVGVREALVWTAVWVALALGFNVGVYVWFGAERALEFLTGYVIEKALSIDNIFVFLVVFSVFAVPAALQHRVLFREVDRLHQPRIETRSIARSKRISRQIEWSR